MSILNKNREKKPSDHKKRKNLSVSERNELDEERLKAIEAYRLMKKRKEMKDLT